MSEDDIKEILKEAYNDELTAKPLPMQNEVSSDINRPIKDISTIV